MYLILFGKSQSFSFYAFTENGLVADFNEIIPDFDLLESQLLNIDSEDNKDTFSKYIFKKGSDVNYSLIKMYSFAQPHQGFRIEGCSYGVALLSSENIKISKNNIQFLKIIKQKFAETILLNNKFTTSNFKNESVLLFEIFKTQIGFKNIDLLSNYGFNLPNTTVGVATTSLLNFDIEISNYSEKIYITEDLDRLLRAQKKWGSTLLKIYEQKGLNIIEFKKNTTEQQNNTSSTNMVNQNNISNFKIQDLTNELSILNLSYKKVVKANKNNKNLMLLLIIILLISLFSLGLMTYKYVMVSDKLNDKSLSELKPEVAQVAPSNEISKINPFEDYIFTDNKKNYIELINLIIKLDSTKSEKNKIKLKRTIIKKGQEFNLDTTIINSNLKNY